MFMRKIALTTAAGLLVAAAPAAALTTAAATPDKARKPSRLHFAIDGTAPAIGGRLPLTLQLHVSPRLRTNLRAIAKRCSEESAKLNECPAASRFGTGRLVVGVTTPAQVRTVTIPLAVYLHSGTRILAVAKVFGWQVVPAALVTHHGLVVTFNPLPQGPPFQGVTYTLKRITLEFGATRLITKRVGMNLRKRRLNLFENPANCTGSWASSILLTFKVGPPAAFSTPVRCSNR